MGRVCLGSRPLRKGVRKVYVDGMTEVRGRLVTLRLSRGEVARLRKHRRKRESVGQIVRRLALNEATRYDAGVPPEFPRALSTDPSAPTSRLPRSVPRHE